MPFQALVMIITTSAPIEIFFIVHGNQTLTVYLSDKIKEGIHSFRRKSFRSECQRKLPKNTAVIRKHRKYLIDQLL